MPSVIIVKTPIMRGARVLHEDHGYITPAQLSGTDTSAEPIVKIATDHIQVSTICRLFVIYQEGVRVIQVRNSLPTQSILIRRDRNDVSNFLRRIKRIAKAIEMATRGRFIHPIHRLCPRN